MQPTKKLIEKVNASFEKNNNTNDYLLKTFLIKMNFLILFAKKSSLVLPRLITNYIQMIIYEDNVGLDVYVDDSAQKVFIFVNHNNKISYILEYSKRV